MSEKKSAYEVVMPKLGLIMTEALLVEWHINDGDWIEKGANLFSLESEKTIIDIEAPTSGYVQILVNVNETVPVMTPVALIKAEEGAVIAQESKPDPDLVKDSAPRPTVKEVPTSGSTLDAGVKASPKARQLARKLNIDLTGIPGTGVRGMVVTADVEQRKTQVADVKASPVARNMATDYGLNLAEITGTGANGMITRDDISRTVRQRLSEGIPPAAKRDPADHLSGLRGIIARRLTDSWNQRPQVTVNSQLDAEALVNDRERRKASGEKISYNTYLIKASALAMAEWPQLNVYLTEDGLIQLDEVNIGLAVDTERGLMVPVLKNAHARTIQDLNQEMLDLVERTLVGKLLPEEYSGGSFTVTNLGGFGVDSFSPIINPPESAILGVGRIVDQPIVEEGAVRAGKTLTLSLSFDHRVIDGAPAAQFLARIVEILIDPAELEKF